MIMPSLLTWVVGTIVLVVVSLLLRFLANEAYELAQARGRASAALGPKSSNTCKKAA
jgi:hypothetical protein